MIAERRGGSSERDVVIVAARRSGLRRRAPGGFERDGPVSALVLQELLHAALGLLEERLATLHQLDPLLELLERVLEAELPALELLDHLLEAVDDVAVALAGRLFSGGHGNRSVYRRDGRPATAERGRRRAGCAGRAFPSPSPRPRRRASPA